MYLVQTTRRRHPTSTTQFDATTMDASNANLHNIEKRIGALERAEHPAEKTKVANMAPLGLWAFSLTTAMLQMKNLSVGIPSDNEGVVIGFALGFGGLVQLLAGLFSAARSQSFAATAFSSYGAFWLSYAGFHIFTDATGTPRNRTAEAAMLFMWALLTFVLFASSFNTNVAISSLFFTLGCLFTLLGVEKCTDSDAARFVSAIFGVGVCVIAFYAGAGELMNEQYNRTCIPLGVFEHAHEGLDRSFNEPRAPRVRVIPR